jgi:hypothetical protein
MAEDFLWISRFRFSVLQQIFDKPGVAMIRRTFGCSEEDLTEVPIHWVLGVRWPRRASR